MKVAYVTGGAHQDYIYPVVTGGAHQDYIYPVVRFAA